MFFVLFYTNLNLGISQNYNCIDSISVQNLINYLDSTKCDDLEVEHLNKVILYKSKEVDLICRLKIYTKIFDKLLSLGLDTDYSQYNRLPISNDGKSFQIVDKQAYLKEKKENDDYNKKYYLCIAFLEIKELYEKDVVNEYRKNNKKSIQNDVKNSIDSSIYSYPTRLKDILLSKHEYMTMRKMSSQAKKLILSTDWKH